MSEDNKMKYEIGDTVRIKDGGPQVYTIKQASSAGPRYLLQLGSDGKNIQWKNEDEIELVEKVKKPDDESRFVPGRGIME
jgi:uncharacterized protein YodC (DUF2158 family)